MVLNPCCYFMAESRLYGSGLSYISTEHRPGLHIHSLAFSLQLLSNCSVNTSQKQAGVQELSISQRNICFGKVSFSQLFRFHFCNHILRIWIQTLMLSSLVDFVSLVIWMFERNRSVQF